MVLPKIFIDNVLSINIPERDRSSVEKYIGKNYGGEDMVELFALKLLLQLKDRGGYSSLSTEQVDEIKGEVVSTELRLCQRGLFVLHNNRTINDDYKEMMRLGFIQRENERKLDNVDNILGRAAYLQMEEALDGCIYEDALLICTSFVNEWDWGEQEETL